MRITTWAAVAVTTLMALGNLGELAQNNGALKVIGPVLGVAGIIAAVGLATRRPWGARAVIGVGAVNLLATIVAAVAEIDGWPIGLVLSALAIVLAAVSVPALRTHKAVVR